MTALEDRLTMIEYAVAVLKQAGFCHVYSSMKSEAAYYRLPGKDGVLRVAAHRYSRTRDKAIQQPVLSCLTFNEGFEPKSEYTLNTMIAHAIGRYMMADGNGTSRWRDGAGRRKAALTAPAMT